MGRYPPFVPPGQLAEIPREKWSRGQADAYAAWLESQIEPRVEHLLSYFGEDGRPAGEDLIRDVGEHLKETLSLRQFSTPTQVGPELTDQGYALAADMGLLGAKWLLSTVNHLVWVVVRKPKSDISFNLPVLRGFGPVDLDPILISINQAYGVLRGKKDGDAWMNGWKHWQGLAQVAETPLDKRRP